MKRRMPRESQEPSSFSIRPVDYIQARSSSSREIILPIVFTVRLSRLVLLVPGVPLDDSPALAEPSMVHFQPQFSFDEDVTSFRSKFIQQPPPPGFQKRDPEKATEEELLFCDDGNVVSPRARGPSNPRVASRHKTRKAPCSISAVDRWTSRRGLHPRVPRILRPTRRNLGALAPGPADTPGDPRCSQKSRNRPPLPEHTWSERAYYVRGW